MEIKNISEAKFKLMEILKKEILSEGDYEELREILNVLYKIETNSEEINVKSYIYFLFKVDRKNQ